MRRRHFLVTVAAGATGALTVGCGSTGMGSDNPLLRELPEGSQALNAYVRIDRDGITLITPRTDMGQGATSIQAALIAEELDLAWGSFRTDPGPPSEVYYNAKVVAEGIPIAATSDGFIARTARAGSGLLAQLLGLQLTGGSTTVPDAFDRLRVAGATARAMLMQAAEARTGVPVSRQRTENGQVVLPDGRRLSYTELAAAAATLKPPSDVRLKPRGQWRLLGRPMQRLDIADKSAGRAVYGIDLRLPGMVHATVRANPRLGGGIRRFNDTAARGLRGVLRIVPMPDGVGVIADNTWRAFQAAAKLDIEWGAAAYAADDAAIAAALKGALDDKHRDSRLCDEGDVDAAFADAEPANRLDATYRVPPLAHAPLEPMNAVVQLKDGRLDIWTATQIPRFVVAQAAKMSGLAPANVHLHAQICGGSFGRRLEDDFVRQAVQLAMAHPGPPIKMTWTREEDMTHDFPRPPALARARGAVRDGRVESMDLTIAAPSVTASQVGRLGLPNAGPDVTIVAGAWDQPFAIPHRRVSGHHAAGLMPVSSWRAVGASHNGFFHECFLDELIRAAGADPLAERLRLCNHEPSRRVLRTIGEMARWNQPLPPSPDGKRGRGLAFTLSFGVPVAEVVEVTATARGIRLDAVHAAVEIGPVLDPVNVEAQVQGGVLWGLDHAIHAELSYRDGAVQQTNLHQISGLRLRHVPPIHVRALDAQAEIRGIGEPAVPPAAAALANAIADATGRRARELPLARHFDFV